MRDGRKTGYLESCGGAEEDRTPDLCIANAALSQLSYRPISSRNSNEIDKLKEAELLIRPLNSVPFFSKVFEFTPQRATARLPLPAGEVMRARARGWVEGNRW